MFIPESSVRSWLSGLFFRYQPPLLSSGTFYQYPCSISASCTMPMAHVNMHSKSPITTSLSSIKEEDLDLQVTDASSVTEEVSLPLPCARQNFTTRSGSQWTEVLSTATNLSRTSSKSTLKRSMRSPSASSFLYHLKKLPMNDVIPLGGNTDPELVKEFLEIAQKRTVAFKANVHKSRAFQVFWYFLVTCIIYFGFIGLPLWDGICYSI